MSRLIKSRSNKTANQLIRKAGYMKINEFVRWYSERGPIDEDGSTKEHIRMFFKSFADEINNNPELINEHQMDLSNPTGFFDAAIEFGDLGYGQYAGSLRDLLQNDIYEHTIDADDSDYKIYDTDVDDSNDDSVIFEVCSMLGYSDEGTKAVCPPKVLELAKSGLYLVNV